MPIAIAMPNVPAMTNARSPTRRTILPKKYPCTDAAVTPMIVNRIASSRSFHPRAAAACSGNATV